MAKKNPNEDPEEERDDQFEDDEDFGLPDLDYDELDEDDESEPAEEPVEESPEEISTELSSEEEAGGLDFEADMSGAEITDADISDADISEADLELSDEDISAELEKDMDSPSDEPDFYEEESFDEFDDSSAQEAVFDAGSQVEEEDSYKDVVETSIPSDPFSEGTDDFLQGEGEVPKDPMAGTEHRGSFTRIVIFGTITFVLIALGLMYFMDGSFGFGDESEEARADEQEQVVEPVKEEAAVSEEPAGEAEATKEPAAEQPKPTPARPATTTAPGTITTLDNSTGKTYVIIASFFDEDLAMDHAKDLASQGKSPMIIPPFKNYRFYRVAIAEFATVREATAAIPQFKPEYGEEIWPLRY